MKTFRFCFLVLLLAVERANGAGWLDTDRGESVFVSRPDIRPQILRITTFEPELVSPGYFFIAPYDRRLENSRRHTYIPSQIGPHIYDGNGELIWSGALQMHQRNVHNFQVTRYNGADALSFSVYKDGSSDVSEQLSTGVIMSSSYEVVKMVLASDGTAGINMHEFLLVDEGRLALLIATRRQYTNESELNRGYWEKTLIQSYGFQEVEVETGRTVFEWWALDHIPIDDTMGAKGGKKADPYHINSVDKTPDGDYVISLRHTSAIYLISGVDGHIIWQLGGFRSSFDQLNGFNFSFQHHARVHEYTKTHITLSFLDNASNSRSTSADRSSGVLVYLDTAASPMTARVLQRWERPDGELSNLRGSVQMLANGNVLVCWSANGYTSEFAPDGRLVQEVRYATARFDDYRAYKFSFVGSPGEPIAVASHTYAASAEAAMTITHVSWNGATEVAAWNLYTIRCDSPVDASTGNACKNVHLGYQQKNGFETVFMVAGLHHRVFVEALDKSGNSLRNSSIEHTVIPPTLTDQQQAIFGAAWEQSSTALSGGEGVNKCGTRDFRPFIAWITGVLEGGGLVAILAILFMRMGIGLKQWRWTRIRGTDDDEDSVREMEEETHQAFLPIHGFVEE